MVINESDFKSIPDIELGHVYKWPILTGIDVDKDFYEKHFDIRIFNSTFYIKFYYDDVTYYHKFLYLNEVKDYVKVKWSIINNKLEKVTHNCCEVPLYIDEHWALVTASKLGHSELINYLKQSNKIDKQNINPLVKYILENGRND